MAKKWTLCWDICTYFDREEYASFEEAKKAFFGRLSRQIGKKDQLDVENLLDDDDENENVGETVSSFLRSFVNGETVDPVPELDVESDDYTVKIGPDGFILKEADQDEGGCNSIPTVMANFVRLDDPDGEYAFFFQDRYFGGVDYIDEELIAYGAFDYVLYLVPGEKDINEVYDSLAAPFDFLKDGSEVFKYLHQGEE